MLLYGPTPSDQQGGDTEPYARPALRPLAECPAGWGVEDVAEEGHSARSVWRDTSGRGMPCGRLDSDWCWGPERERLGEWYQLDAGEVRSIGGVATGGAAGGGKWCREVDYFVRSFTVLHSKDGKGWAPADDGAVYDSNDSGAGIVFVKFARPVWARYIRIYPRRWHREIALRVGLLVRSREKQERGEARSALLALSRRCGAQLPGDVAGEVLRCILPVPPHARRGYDDG